MILTFSGTGNSRYAARKIAERLGDQVVSINDQLRAGQPGVYTSECPYVIVSPVYAWRLPRIVEQFLRSAVLDGSRELYFVLTCGGHAGCADRYLPALCRDLNKNFRGLFPIRMPENYIALYDTPDEDEIRELMSAARPLMEEAAALIAAGQDFPLPQHQTGDSLLSGLVNPLFYPLVVKAKKFRVTDKCVGCGQCEQLCPLHNIRLSGGRPVWGKDCTHCMACICACPTEAIEYGKVTENRRRYYLK